MKDIQVNIFHATWCRCLNGTAIPNDILRSVQDTADDLHGDIVAELSVRGPGHKSKYHYDYDNAQWHDEDGFILLEDGDWAKDPDWSWPKHLVDDQHREDGTEQVHA